MKTKKSEHRQGKRGERAREIFAAIVATVITFYLLGLPVSGRSPLGYWLAYVLWATFLCVLARFVFDLAEPGLHNQYHRLFDKRKHRAG